MAHPPLNHDCDAPEDADAHPGTGGGPADQRLSKNPKQSANSKQLGSSESPIESAGSELENAKKRPKRPKVLRAPLAKAARLAEQAQIESMLPISDPGGRFRGWSPPPRHRFLFSCLISAAVHGAVLIGLSLWILRIPQGLGQVDLFAATEGRQTLEGMEAEVVLRTEVDELSPKRVELALHQSRVNILQEAFTETDDTSQPSPQPVEVGDPAQPWGLQGAELIKSVMRPTGGGLEGRSPNLRSKLALGDGGTVQSEEAVERGLRWIAAHQGEDGGWSFDLKKGSCRGRCKNPGTEPNTAAATALALLPFLGAGYTHQEGIYEDALRKGLYYMLRRGRVTEHGLDFQEGTKTGMYAQGLVAIVLCEAWAMTKDPALKDPAQEAIRFIEYAQDQKGGGWRYRPGEPGDTTVTGWQLMALKSAEMAGLKVDRAIQYAAQRFLDSVASEEGAQYGYLDRSPRRSTTAIGLLCRMYGGWVRGHPPLARGIGHLATWGPSPVDIYYNYYATQVLRHWGGSDWKRWNDTMREHLIRTQATEGHESGSWYFDDEHSRVGGRLYTTAMAVMILEVYYRYMPLYGKQVFPEL